MEGVEHLREEIYFLYNVKYPASDLFVEQASAQHFTSHIIFKTDNGSSLLTNA